MTAVWTAAGFLLLALLGTDVFITTFDARGTGGPIVQRLNRSVWGTLRMVRRRAPRLGDRILATGGPVMAIATLVTWATLLVLAFTLVYLPHVLTFHHSVEPSSTRFLEAFYYSGMLASTVGLGDVVPPNGWTRALAVVEGLGGFALLTVSTSYILAVYREQLNAQTVATTIDVQLAGGGLPESSDPKAEGTGGGTMETTTSAVRGFAAWEREITRSLLRVLAAHFQYPVLHYFRSSDPAHALPVQMARLHRFHRRIEREADEGSDAARALASHPSHLALARAIEQYVAEIHRHFVRTSVREGTPPDEVETTEGRLRQFLRTLEWEETPSGG